MMNGIHRQRLACVECTRRKVKCDKVLPCRNCTRKGATCTRPRERNSPSHGVTPLEARPVRPFIARPSTDSSSKTIERLQARVNDLENALKESVGSHSRPAITRADPPAAESISHQSPFSVRTSVRGDIDTNTPREVEDAATILEFLAWGRRKDPSYHDEIARQSNIDQSPGDISVEDESEGIFKTSPSVSALCQAFLPNKAKVYQLVNYHCECLLWYHGAFHAKTFLAELDVFYEDEARIDHFEGSPSRLQWISLLFAILTGSMAGAPRSVAESWGFHGREKDTLSKRWLKTSIACLHQANYMACHSIYSVEAIATLTISVHMLGHSNGFSVLLASAVRIAQGLGLHQLGEESELSTPGLTEREIGRRVWCQLCIQDWFSIPFTESYLIHNLGFNTAKPQNRDENMRLLPDETPSVTGFSRLKYDIAALMPGLQDDCTSRNTLYTRYEEVLAYDRRLRILATQHLPRYLQNVPLDPDWPCYVPWARRSLAISSAHKVIMIHRKFLSLSFTNPMFEFTRKTCVAASRTIIKEQKEATREGGPVLWIQQAFSVTASIILCLDMFHQSTDQSAEHRQLIEDGIEILSHCESDMIAQRGVSLLRAMLEAQQLNTRPPTPGLRPSLLPGTPSSESGLDIAGIIRAFYQNDRARVPGLSSSKSILQVSSSRMADSRHWSEITNCDGVMSGIDITGFGAEYAEGLDDILNLATNYLN